VVLGNHKIGASINRRGAPFGPCQPLARERLREIDAEHLVYESIKPGARGSGSLILTPARTDRASGGLDSAIAPAGC